VNRIRHEHPALQRDDTLTFHRVDNPQLLAYSKASPDGSDVVLVVVNLDPTWRQSGWTDLDLGALGLEPDASFSVRDLLTGRAFVWRGAANYLELQPGVRPAHVLAVEANDGDGASREKGRAASKEKGRAASKEKADS
jgi:starch synthase (maltosyl-transferring)